MREKIVIGNWKMNTNFDEAISLASSINSLLSKEIKSVILVPFVYINSVQGMCSPNLKVGAQNVSEYKNGAYTGEISAEMLRSLKVEYVTIGHSERRTIFNENNEIIANKIETALANQLKPILCCGEPLEVRKNGTYISFVENQLTDALKNVSSSEIKNVIIAYEPIWAIGTGETASAAQAQEVHSSIRTLLEKLYNKEIAQNISILYGGSVKAENAKELFSEKDIDGALVGGASLKATSFIDIITANNEL